jgi:hypothetical protein
MREEVHVWSPNPYQATNLFRKVAVDCEKTCNPYQYITSNTNNKNILATLAFDLLIMMAYFTDCPQARPEFAI